MLHSDIICLHCWPVGNISTQPPSSHSPFRKRFIRPSGVYKRLGQFNYGQPGYTADHITKCVDGNQWIYIGEVKEGTDHTRHGIGIRVLSIGDTQQLNKKFN